MSFLIHILARHKKHSNNVESCHTCKRSKYQVFSPEGFLQVQPLPTSNDIWEDIDIDFIVCLPKSKGFAFDAILVVVNRFGKYGNFILILHLYSARSIVEMFAKKAVKLHTSVASDRDPTFFSHFWKEFFRKEGTGLMMSTPYHPESDGKTEVLNRTLETYLWCFSSEQPKTWTVLYHWDEIMVQHWWSRGCEMHTFWNCGWQTPPCLAISRSGKAFVKAVTQDLITRDETLKQLKFHFKCSMSNVQAC